MTTQTPTKTTAKITTASTYCINHPSTETLLHCYRCGSPVCIKCVRRTPVGWLCKRCVSNQQAGFYSANILDYALVVVVGLVVSLIAGAIAHQVGGFWYFAILYAAPVGGVIAEVLRFVIRKRRGRYIGLVAAATVVLGALVAVEGLPIFFALETGEWFLLTQGLFDVGIWIYVALATSTVYARLR